MRASGALAFLVLTGLAAWVALANRHLVSVSFDAFRPDSPSAIITVPLFAVLFAGVLAGLVIGSLYMWVAGGHYRRVWRGERARADRLQKMLTDEVLAPKATVKINPALSQIAD
jgi:hypothetical protein